VAQAQRKKGAQGGSGKNNQGLYWILGILAVAVLGGVLYAVGGGPSGSVATEPVDLGEIDDRQLVEMAQGVVKGDPEAAIWILEFADFQCPACQAFAQGVKPLLEMNYIESGKVRFVYHDFPLINIHPNAFLAARAGRCAEEQGRFWEYHDEIYRNQAQWSMQANPVGTFTNYAEAAGLQSGAFGQCLRSDRHADLVTANMQLGIALGVPGTPSLMIRQGSGIARRLPSSDYATIATAIEEALSAMEGT
jgi:protein-disulfide isomerase